MQNASNSMAVWAIMTTPMQRLERHFGVHRAEAIARGMQFRAADVRCAVQHLALKVAEVHDIEVNEPDTTDAGGGQIQSQGRTKAARADQENARAFQPLLALQRHLRHDQVPAVTSDFLRGK